MELAARLRDDLHTALKGGERTRADVLRFVLADLHNGEIEKKRPLTDEEIIASLRKEAKRRKESITMFRTGNRIDLAEKEEAELHILSVYLPEEMGIDEIEAVVRRIASSGVSGFNAVMREAMQALKGKADGKIVQEIVKKVIGE